MRIKPVLLLSPLPLLAFGTYGALRLAHVQPEQEPGMSEFMTSAFLLIGTGVCYFAGSVLGLGDRMREYCRWMAASGFLLLLAVDESFMVHENLARLTQVSESHVFLLYGAVLLAILVLFRRSQRYFWIMLLGFIVSCGISQTADTLQGEGSIRLLGRDIDYEQILECVGTMFLSAAFAFEAASALQRHYRCKFSVAADQ